MNSMIVLSPLRLTFFCLVVLRSKKQQLFSYCLLLITHNTRVMITLSSSPALEEIFVLLEVGPFQLSL